MHCVCVPDDPVCALSNHILDIILLGDIEGYLPRASARTGRARHAGDLGDPLALLRNERGLIELLFSRWRAQNIGSVSVNGGREMEIARLLGGNLHPLFVSKTMKVECRHYARCGMKRGAARRHWHRYSRRGRRRVSGSGSGGRYSPTWPTKHACMKGALDTHDGALESTKGRIALDAYCCGAGNEMAHIPLEFKLSSHRSIEVVCSREPVPPGRCSVESFARRPS